ncbi:protein NUCLEAR FUSION DEFECTIVE 4-like [Impatiens glandulifera]|uniref:protein NUCLEAR FUSION DEFECTIVE 4-like n=1 Tax=Impatiens glandulifera TaxID=253017 RepID=UPI001FB12BA2|nr:protein NUCLEAR FUSION DEFECTIVE 4-like [Impatiens glandulifera]
MAFQFQGKTRDFFNNRWLVFVASMWVQSCAGIGYLFGSISPVIKSSMGYNQRQIAVLGVAKDLGDSVGFIAGSLCEILPIWAVLAVGIVQNFIGYGLVWLIITQRLPNLPLWVLCIAMFIGTNGETYFNTGALVASIQNFPRSRGPVVGILKGFAGLSGAILSQIYDLFSSSSNEPSLILMIAILPSVIVISLMFIVRPVGGHRQVRPSDDRSFLSVYCFCLGLAIYLMVVLLLEDLVDLSQTIIILFSVLLIVFIILPVLLPVFLVFIPNQTLSLHEDLLLEPHSQNEVIMSEVDEIRSDDDLSSSSLSLSLERRKRLNQLQAKLFQAAAEGAVRVNRKKRPHRGENFTLMQALVKADFWLMFLSLVLASGSGLTIIDNLGQICLSLEYSHTHVFVSMISICNFLGRVGGGYFSELIVRKYSCPRPLALAVAQLIMAFALLFYALGLPGEIYVLTILVGIGYGAHWAIVPAAASELFGLKSFGALYNFLTLSNPIGSLIFSGVIASGIYDLEAEKQSSLATNEESSVTCYGIVCYSLTCGILSGLCVVAVILSSLVVYRTKRVYAQLYGNSH